MKIKRRWIMGIIREAEQVDIRLPFERGAPRAAMIARRSQKYCPLKALRA